MFALVATMFTACTKNYNYNYEIENVTVTLDANEMIAIVEKDFSKSSVAKYNKVASLTPMAMSTTATTDDYEHQFPTSYKAYFVSKETKGEYTKDQVVKVIDVEAGENTITIPKLNYDIYVTNYSQEGEWYKWNNAVDQLPQTSDELYLYGKNNINYSVVTTGEVEVFNPYAAVMIRNNQWVNGVPTSYDTGQDYFLTLSSSWYVLYIRNDNTNTKVPIEIAGNPNTHYTLKRKIEANNIYQYTIDGSVPVLGDGNLGIIVKPFEKVIEETIKL